MKKGLFILLIFCFSLTIISCSDDKQEHSATGTTDNTTTTSTTALVWDQGSWDSHNWQ